MSQPQTPSKGNGQAPKLSLVAQFDDLCRQQNSILQSQAIEEEVVALLESMEQCRIRWSQHEREIIRLKEQIRQLEQNNKTLDTKLKNVRFALTNEIAARDKMQKERDAYARKLQMVRQLLLEDQQSSHEPTFVEARQRVLSALNFGPPLTPVQEVQHTDSDESGSDLEYDRTGEDLLQSFTCKRQSGKRKSSGVRKSGQTPTKSPRDRSKRARSIEERMEEDVCIEHGVEVEEHYHLRRNSPSKKTADDNNGNAVAKTKALYRADTLYSPVRKLANKPATASTPALPRGLTLPRNDNGGSQKPAHNFVTKKVFRPGEKCGPCGGSIGFCGTCLKCRDCRATCHPDCKDKVPLPCVPYVNRIEGNRGGRLTLISDYAPKSRPQVPALIVHCTKEIERRGLDEAGLYRIPGSDREVKDLKERIIRSKNGIPPLGDIDVHVLCGVVKEFLRSLDEPLVTRVLWRDFVRASEYTSRDEQLENAWHAITELPTANKDTLAYMVLHLQRVAQSVACKMPTENLARVFGPTIVGHSMPDPPMVEMLAENRKQIAVMDVLLNILGERWTSIIGSTDNNYQTVADNARNEEKYTHRSSFGARPLGGHVQVNGTMTPRVTRNNANQTMYGTSSSSRKPLFLKPLF